MTPPLPDPVALAQTLIRFDTTNPPGNEMEAVAYLQALLEQHGFQTTVLARAPQRPNLLARLKGRGAAPPLLLYGHLDVVTTANQSWSVPPFAGEIRDGMLWGRGALDMKSGVAQLVAAALRLAADGPPAGDLLLALVADEEHNGDYGARYLVEEHAALFAGIRYAIGEGGGFSQYMLGRKLYPIMVGEKQFCALRVTVRGPAGHASMPRRDNALYDVAQLLTALDEGHLPLHVTPVVRQMVEETAATLPLPARLTVRQVLNRRLAHPLLAALGDAGRPLYAMLHNTAVPTIVNGGEKVNVIPGEITLDLDGRLLPGMVPDDLVRELRALWKLRPDDDNITIDVLRHEPCPSEPDMTLYRILSRVMRRADPQGTPVPLLLPAVTDARYFTRLGIQTYGFLPQDLPPGLLDTIHNADERIPVATLRWGTGVLQTALRELHGALT